MKSVKHEVCNQIRHSFWEQCDGYVPDILRYQVFSPVAVAVGTNVRPHILIQALEQRDREYSND